MLAGLTGLLGGGGAGGGGSSFESIATASGTGSAGTITFSSIPSTYKHLQLRCLAKDTYTASEGAQEGWIQFNGITTSTYSYHRLRGNGTTVTAGAVDTNTVQDDSITLALGTNSAFGVSIIDIMDYASTSKFKVTKSFNGGDINTSGTSVIRLSSGLFRSTAAISSITIGGSIFGFTTTSRFALYGIKG
jgi:hypothetical protein